MSIQQSPELSALCLRWFTAVANNDSSTIANLYSRSTSATYLGSDDAEMWVGRDVGTAVARHWDEVANNFNLSLDETVEIDAYENGDTGWALMRSGLTFGPHATFPFRISLVFLLEDGVWKVLHSHNSIAIDNYEAVGVTMTTVLEDLVDSLDEEAATALRSVVPQGTVTLMFTDIEDSTKLATRLGDDAWSGVILEHDKTVAEVANAHGGVVVKTLGDGAMVVFSSTKAGAAAAQEIQAAFASRSERPEVRTRIGLHVGDVLHTGDDYLGVEVNKAARIAAAARGGETLISETVRMLLGDSTDLEFGESFETELKGLPGHHTLMPLN